MLNLAPGVSEASVRATIEGWQDVSLYSQAEQRALILGGVVEKTRRQIGLFRGLVIGQCSPSRGSAHTLSQKATFRRSGYEPEEGYLEPPCICLRDYMGVHRDG